MSSNTHISLFQIAELVSMIAEHLTLHDIATLSITCKSLHQHLRPSLWKNVIIKKNKPEHKSLLENRRHIRTLHIERSHESMLDLLTSAMQPSEPNEPIASDTSCIIDTSTSTVPAITNIQKLTILPGKSEKIYFPKASIILSQSPHLVQLRFPISWFLDYEDQFLYILSNGLPHLMKISASEGVLDPETAIRFLQACFQHPQLRTLEYGFGIHFGRDYDRSLNELLTSSTPAENKMESTVVSSPPSKITTIRLKCDRFYDYHMYPASFLIRDLLNHCPYLERFEAPRMDSVYKGMSETYPGILCLNLQHIKFTARGYGTKEFINFIIEECSRGTGLKSCQLGFPVKGTYANETLNNLAQHHSGTLEDVEILDSLTVCSQGIRSVLESSEGLKRFRNGHIMFYNTNCNELVKCDWACSNLRTLSLEVVLDPSIYMADGGAWTVSEKLFRQIGRLTKLETLALGWVDSDGGKILGEDRKEELVKRCLAQLASLSNLRQFQMLTDCWSPIGQDEVELIHNSWLPLRRVIFIRQEQFLSEQPHWQWLQERRLSLQFSCAKD